METWKQIKGFPNYELSSLGRVKSLPNEKNKKEKIIKPYGNKVQLYINGARFIYSINTLMIENYERIG